MSKKDRRERKKQRRLAQQPQSPTVTKSAALPSAPVSAPSRRVRNEPLPKELEDIPLQSIEGFRDIAQLLGTTLAEFCEPGSNPPRPQARQSAPESKTTQASNPSESENHGHDHEPGRCQSCGEWPETTYRLREDLALMVFLGICKKLGIKVFRPAKAHRTTVSISINPQFKELYFNPLLFSMIGKLNDYINSNINPWIENELSLVPPPPPNLNP